MTLEKHDYGTLLAGCSLAFAFAPTQMTLLGVLAPAILLASTLAAQSLKQAFWRGFLFGIGFFSVGVSWVYISIHRFGHSSIPVSFLLTALFILFLALFYALISYSLQRFFQGTTPHKCLIAFPCLWVFSEWLRSHLWVGFPWLLLGYSQTETWLAAYAPIIGVYGLSFLLALSAGLIVYAWHHRHYTQTALLSFVLLASLWIAGFFLHSVKWTHNSGSPLQAALIQGNTDQDEQWTPEAFARILATYTRLTRAHWASDIIVWPENALPTPLHYVKNIIDSLHKEARQQNTTLIMGLPIAAGQDRFYNAAIARGLGSGTYYKHHLVPFGEYIPFEHTLRGLIHFFDLPMSNFIAGPARQPLLISRGLKIALLICYEIAYAQTLRTDLPDANMLVTLNNDAWFGDSLAPAQHVQMAQMRSLQTGRYQLLAANTGISAIIAPDGRIVASMPQFKSGVVSGEFYRRTGATPWVRMGNNTIMMICLLLFIMACFLDRISCPIISVRT